MGSVKGSGAWRFDDGLDDGPGEGDASRGERRRREVSIAGDRERERVPDGESDGTGSDGGSGAGTSKKAVGGFKASSWEVFGVAGNSATLGT
jgi:hypothetical protein